MAAASGGDQDRWAAEWFRKGNDAMQKQNWALAVEAFSQCVRIKPAYLNYRQLLRNATKKKYGDNKKGAGTFEKTKLMGIRSRMKKAKTAEQWDDADRALEEGLLINPWDTQLNVELAEISLKLERGEIAKFAYREAVFTDPKNKEILFSLATLLRARREYDEAIKVWEHVAKLDPADLTAMRRITELQTEKTTDRGGYDDAANTRDVMSNKNAGGGQALGSVAPGESQETDLKHAIRKEPGKVEPYLKLGAYYKSARRYDDAYQIMEAGLKASNNDPAVREQLEDIELLQKKFALDDAKEQANKSNDPEARKAVAALANAFRDRQIEVFSARVERYQQNLGIKYDLAVLLMQLQQWAKAIPLLQKSSQDPRLKAKSFVALGKCFMYDKKLPLARGQFERAMPDLNHETDPDIFKECYYLSGRVCEELKDFPTAEKYYGEVLVVDYDYKDARERLEKLQGGGEGAA